MPAARLRAPPYGRARSLLLLLPLRAGGQPCVTAGHGDAGRVRQALEREGQLLDARVQAPLPEARAQHASASQAQVALTVKNPQILNAQLQIIKVG